MGGQDAPKRELATVRSSQLERSTLGQGLSPKVPDRLMFKLEQVRLLFYVGLFLLEDWIVDTGEEEAMGRGTWLALPTTRDKS